MVYCACYHVDSWNKFLYSYYLFLLQSIPVTQIFLLFIPVISLIHVYTNTHTTVVHNIWECFLNIYNMFLYEESCAPIRPCSHTLYYSTNHLEMGRVDNWLDLIGWVSWIHCCPTVGDVAVLAIACIVYNSLSFLFHASALAVARVSAARGLFKVVILGVHEIHPPDHSLSIVKSHGTRLNIHR